MARRTQITLSEDQYKRLIALSDETGMSMSELIRRALDRTYASGGPDALSASFGAWRSRDFDGEEYVENIREGLADRLADGGPG